MTALAATQTATTLDMVVLYTILGVALVVGIVARRRQDRDDREGDR